ncbi:unnamed protein product [Merluccius merluccius]
MCWRTHGSSRHATLAPTVGQHDSPQQIQPVTALAQMLAEIVAMNHDQAMENQQRVARLQAQTERQTQLLEAMLSWAGAASPASG